MELGSTSSPLSYWNGSRDFRYYCLDIFRRAGFSAISVCGWNNELYVKAFFKFKTITAGERVHEPNSKAQGCVDKINKLNRVVCFMQLVQNFHDRCSFSTSNRDKMPPVG